MKSQTISDAPPAEFPFESKFIEVHGSKMHYIDEGEGETILFIHGNPTSSYLWRNVIPHVSKNARCVALDLIGMGRSDNPDIEFTYDDHYRYLSGFIDALGIGKNVTLVIHDWGSILGFRWAHDHPESVRGIAFMEAMLRPLSYKDLPGGLKIAMRIMRVPAANWLLVGVGNVFLKKLLPDLTYQTMRPEVLAHYRDAFPTVRSRRAVRRFPREVPFDGKPAKNHEIVVGYNQWLQEADFPKLLLHGDDGVGTQAPDIAWCKETLSNLQVVDLGHGKHFLQETHPDAIGKAVAGWYGSL
jgi:haloalkane dehalogenase